VSLGRQAKLLACAVQFLTRLPTPPLADYAPDWTARAARFFPLVGLVVGGICAAVWLAAGRFWPGLPAAILALAAGALVTGGFHEDGLADTADGFGGGGDRERRLAIMKDSRIGTFGVLALGLTLALKAALLSGLSAWAGAAALLVAHAGGRAAAVAVMAALPYAGDHAAAKVAPAQGLRPFEVAAALAVGAVPLVLLSPVRALFAVVLATLVSVVTARLARRLIGGVTGDVLGAVEQLVETALLLAVSVRVDP